MIEPNLSLEIGTYLKNCDSKDVIASSGKSLLYINRLCDLVLSSLDRNITSAFAYSIKNKISNRWKTESWLNDGEKCEILKADSLGWQKGKITLKVNVTLEFVPDEPEVEPSPLDDIRQTKINNIE